MNLETIDIPKFGFGMMRLPETEEGMDLAQIKQMVDISMNNGFNYFDTAYVYDGGRSEEIIKEAIVERYPREDFFLASKLPAWKLNDKSDRDRIFNESMERMGVDYIDYYLLHSLEDGKHYKTYEDLDCFEWAKQKKKEGKIKHFGFSFHGSSELLEEVLDKHPEVEFVQIQLNYEDWDSPAVNSGKLYEILKKREIPIIVMEPVKGGRLAEPGEEIEKMLQEVEPGATPASIALRFAGSLEGVTMILSGMSNLDQMRENVETFYNFKPLSESQLQEIGKIVKKITNDMPTIGCTACKYCIEGCPVHISIPNVIRAVNMERLYPGKSRQKSFYNSLINSGAGRASDCIECGQCESVCPQHLPIIQIMKEAKQIFDVD